jgi:hypothetical protein
VTCWLKARIVEQIDAATDRQQCSKHISPAIYTDATVEDAVFSMQSVLRLHNKDQLDKPVTQQSVRGRGWRLAVLSCIVSSSYLVMRSDQTEGFMCAVVTVIFRVCKTVRLL